MWLTHTSLIPVQKWVELETQKLLLATIHTRSLLKRAAAKPPMVADPRGVLEELRAQQEQLTLSAETFLFEASKLVAKKAEALSSCLALWRTEWQQSVDCGLRSYLQKPRWGMS